MEDVDVVRSRCDMDGNDYAPDHGLSDDVPLTCRINPGDLLRSVRSLLIEGAVIGVCLGKARGER
ncbi:hypothetical protein DPMN_158850 [Dreissena polymorpha]|uniref:Uncharacterized protein n=1 Tax=Dreissena polymorpha TaxID=45954 RepID=A0A9D4INL2_DREPO|nr:hypothetical protein DPMN_158850 [Dreissena polymorpha]